MGNVGESRPSQVNNADRPRTSSVIAADFLYLKQKMQNDHAANVSRKTSRLSKGLDPNAPRKTKQQEQCKKYINNSPPKK